MLKKVPSIFLIFMLVFILSACSQNSSVVRSTRPEITYVNSKTVKASIKNAYSAHVAAMAEAGKSYQNLWDYLYSDGENTYTFNSNGETLIVKFDNYKVQQAGTYGEWTLYEIIE